MVDSRVRRDLVSVKTPTGSIRGCFRGRGTGKEMRGRYRKSWL